MIRFLKTVVCIIFASFFCNVTEANLDFFSRVYLSNKKYSENISVRIYLITENQLIDYLNTETKSTIQQLTNKELYNKKSKDLFLVVECKNFGEKNAFGELRVQVPGMNALIPIYCHGMPGLMTTFVNCVVTSLGSLAVLDTNNLPLMTYHWENLYTL